MRPSASRSSPHSASPLQERLLTAGPLQPAGTGGLELTFLGSSSQGGARRYPSSMAMRLRAMASSEVWLFDTGEGALAQLQRSSMKVGLVRNIFITHLHGDHLYGLPGIVLSVLRSRLPETVSENTAAVRKEEAEQPLDIYGPQGLRSFLRMSLGVAGFHMPGKNVLRIHELVWPAEFGPKGKRNRGRVASSYWKTNVKRLQYEAQGRDIEPLVCGDGPRQYTYDLMNGDDAVLLEGQDCGSNGRRAGMTRKWAMAEGPASVVAAPVLHTVPTFAFSVTENVVSRRFDKTKLQQLAIPTDGTSRSLFQNWMNGKKAVWGGREIAAEEVMQDGRGPRRVCVIGDTYDAEGAAHIAQNADVLVHEATNVAAQTSIARVRGHSSTLGATAFAKLVDAKRLILNHTSVGYSERKIRAMESETRSMFGANKAFVARDLSVFSVPTSDEDCDEFVFRRFVGFANSLEYTGPNDKDNPFQQDLFVDDSETFEAGARPQVKAENYVDEDDDGDADMDMGEDMDEELELESLEDREEDIDGDDEKDAESREDDSRCSRTVVVEELSKLGRGKTQRVSA